MLTALVVGLATLLVITSALLIVLILLHRGKGGGLSDLFGGGVSSSVGGSSVAEKNLDRLTIGLGLVWTACIVAGGSAIRGSRVGAGPMGEAERGETAPRVYITFWCARGHETTPSFAADAPVPETWDCPRCGWPASQNQEAPPAPPKVEPYKTHLAYVKERRSDEDGAAILEEALDRLRRS